jgi:hypothetical protein
MQVTSRRLSRVGLLVIGASTLLALVGSSDKGHAATDPLEECVDYAAALTRCFGEGRHITPPRPPKGEQARAVARKRCIEDRRRLERACK